MLLRTNQEKRDKNLEKLNKDQAHNLEGINPILFEGLHGRMIHKG